MSRARSLAVFFAQSAAAGLAAAFVIVLVRPELANLTRAGVGRAAEPSSYAHAVAVSSPAVVNVETERQPYATRNGIVTPRMVGSGVILRADGYVVTNWHVVAECTDADEEGCLEWHVSNQIVVKLADGRVAKAALVGDDRDTELALLKIDLPNLPTIALGRSDELDVGDVVLAIGNARGLSQTVTMGIVSAVGRSLSQELAPFENFIQTDAAINAGNSGGALVNARGELVGINIAVVSDLAGGGAMAEGLGFAIPVNLVRGVVDQLLEHGRVIRGYLGVGVPRDLPASVTQAYGVSGPAVQLVVVSGPAAAAGLRAGDVLTHINGQRIYTRQQALNVVAGMPPGASVDITVVRPDRSTFTTRAILEEREPNVGN